MRRSNESAVNLYKKQGFEIQRELECFQINKNQYNFINNHKVELANKIDLNQLARFWDFNPSWQNSIDSVNAILDFFLYSTVRFDDTIVGYGIIDKKIVSDFDHFQHLLCRKKYRQDFIDCPQGLNCLGGSLFKFLMKLLEGY